MVGLNCQVILWRMDDDAPDNIGGAMITGTIAYQDVHARIEPIEARMELLQQGIETVKLYKAMLVPQTLVISDRDELQVTKPTNHKLFGDRLRIVSIREDALHPSDKRGHIELILSKIRKGRTLA